MDESGTPDFLTAAKASQPEACGAAFRRHRRNQEVKPGLPPKEPLRVPLIPRMLVRSSYFISLAEQTRAAYAMADTRGTITIARALEQHPSCQPKPAGVFIAWISFSDCLLG
jgi:hypothetical protein